MNFKYKNRGYSLPEIIFYVAFFSVLTAIVVGMLVRMSNSRERLQASQKVANSATVSLDRMVREIRTASDMSTSTSILDTNPGKLYLTSRDASGNIRSVEFYIATNTLRIKENNVDMGPLTEKGVSITNLIFRRSASSTDQAIKVEMTLESGTSTSYKSEKFYSTTILRQSI